MARRIILAVAHGPVTPRHRYAAELCFETICGFELVDVVTAQEAEGREGEVVWYGREFEFEIEVEVGVEVEVEVEVEVGTGDDGAETPVAAETGTV